MAESGTEALEARLRARTAAGALVEDPGGGRLRCVACGHRCALRPGQAGICKVRFHDGEGLRVPWGYAASLQLDPIEKKPFFHAFPGERALSFGMLGCDLRCGYCQNWLTSQALRDPAAGAATEPLDPERFADLAVQLGAKVVTSTYNEPLISAEWAVELFRRTKPRGLVGSFVSNGNGTPEALDFLRPWVDLYKVDLKGFRQQGYASLGGSLQKVLDTIVALKARRFWIEVVTLVVPGFNDGEAELRDLARFLAGVDVDIPWHVTAFHRDYRMHGPENTGAAALLRAADIGRSEGLRFVYAGNLAGRVADLEHTFCPGCRRPVIERSGFRVLRNRLEAGSCPGCGTRIPGVWSEADLRARVAPTPS